MRRQRYEILEVQVKTEAAVVSGPGEGWQIVELDLDAPRTGEVLLRGVGVVDEAVIGDCSAGRKASRCA
jgi:hypothetical protein